MGSIELRVFVKMFDDGNGSSCDEPGLHSTSFYPRENSTDSQTSFSIESRKIVHFNSQTDELSLDNFTQNHINKEEENFRNISEESKNEELRTENQDSEKASQMTDEHSLHSTIKELGTDLNYNACDKVKMNQVSNSDNLIPNVFQGMKKVIPYRKPKHEDYAPCESRVSSFLQSSESLIKSADDLASAGFFYTGVGDLIKCFHCGGGLKNWDTEDDPWIEHAHWFPKCMFLRQNKGDDYINLIQQLSLNDIAENGTKDGTNETIWEQSAGILEESTDKPIDKTICKVCMTCEISIVFLPCGHLATCGQCSSAMLKCPICRQSVQGTVKAYIS